MLVEEERSGMQVVRWLHCRRLTLLAAISSLDTKSHGEDIWRALGVECPQVLLLRLTRTTSGTTTLLNAYLAFPAMTSHPDSWEVSPPGDFYTLRFIAISCAGELQGQICDRQSRAVFPSPAGRFRLSENKTINLKMSA